MSGFLCSLFGCKEVEDLSGYPAYSMTWAIISHCSRCGKKFRTSDDLFAPQRPSHFPLHMDFMVDKRK